MICQYNRFRSVDYCSLIKTQVLKSKRIRTIDFQVDSNFKFVPNLLILKMPKRFQGKIIAKKLEKIIFFFANYHYLNSLKIEFGYRSNESNEKCMKMDISPTSMSKQMVNAMILASVCQARSNQEQYAHMLKLENEARDNLHAVRKIKEQLYNTQMSYDRDVSEEAPYDAKKSKYHTEKEDFNKRFNKFWNQLLCIHYDLCTQNDNWFEIFKMIFAMKFQCGLSFMWNSLFKCKESSIKTKQLKSNVLLWKRNNATL